MRKIIFCGLICWMGGCRMAGDLNWLTSLPEAQAEAQKEKKLILLQFTGSDWCPGCIKLETNVLSKPEFQNYARKNLVLLLVDFPSKKPQSEQLQAANDALQDKYNIQGYPTLLLTRPDGTEVWRQEIPPPAEDASMLIGKLDEVRKK